LCQRKIYLNSIEARARAVADLGEHERAAIERDDVDLTGPAAVVALKHAQTACFEKARGEHLRGLAVNSALRHGLARCDRAAQNGLRRTGRAAGERRER
jgi:hypothetical protein